MILSILYVFLLAAGSNSSPCILNTGSSNSSSTTEAKAAHHRDGYGTNGTNNAKAGVTLVLPSSTTNTSNAASASSGSSGTSEISGSLTSASGSCRQGFLNTVFNTNAGQSPGFPSTTWSTLTKHGINEWIGFSLKTLDKQSTYGLSATQASQLSGAFNKAQIPIVMDRSYIQDATKMLANNTPPYLELFNEPDYSFEGFTPTEDAAPSAQDLKVLFDTPHPDTKYISPALMNANSPWLSQFFQACNGCIDQIDVIAMHIYNPNPDDVIALIQQLYNTWKKTIWITELSPAAAGCGLTPDTMGPNYINVLIPKILALGYVEKIFWNSGENDGTPINGAPGPCNPNLTNMDGSATPVLEALGAACGVHAGTATS